MGALSLSFFSTSVRVSRFKKIPRNNISCQFENISHFNLFAAGFEFPIMDKFFVCIVFAGMIVTTVSGRPTEEEESDGTQMLSPYLDGTVVEGRPKETIEKDGTISLEFESPEIKLSGCVRRTDEERDCHSQLCQQQQQRVASRRCGIPKMCSRIVGCVESAELPGNEKLNCH